jgi:hypothetical protein
LLRANFSLFLSFRPALDRNGVVENQKAKVPDGDASPPKGTLRARANQKTRARLVRDETPNSPRQFETFYQRLRDTWYGWEPIFHP